MAAGQVIQQKYLEECRPNGSGSAHPAWLSSIDLKALACAELGTDCLVRHHFAFLLHLSLSLFLGQCSTPSVVFKQVLPSRLQQRTQSNAIPAL